MNSAHDRVAFAEYQLNKPRVHRIRFGVLFRCIGGLYSIERYYSPISRGDRGFSKNENVTILQRAGSGVPEGIQKPGDHVFAWHN